VDRIEVGGDLKGSQVLQPPRRPPTLPILPFLLGILGGEEDEVEVDDGSAEDEPQEARDKAAKQHQVAQEPKGEDYQGGTSSSARPYDPQYAQQCARRHHQRRRQHEQRAKAVKGHLRERHHIMRAQLLELIACTNSSKFVHPLLPAQRKEMGLGFRVQGLGFRV
jgi:hypothetical protein